MLKFTNMMHWTTPHNYTRLLFT